MGNHQKRVRAEKLKADRVLDIPPAFLDDDEPLKKGDRTRLTELVRYARFAVYLLAAIAAMLFVPFLRDAVSVIVGLFG